MLIANMQESRGALHPVRYALSGQDKSPDPFIASTENETLSRLQKQFSLVLFWLYLFCQFCFLMRKTVTELKIK